MDPLPAVDTKQVIVMRTDLQMRKGKMIAQGSHASMAFLTRKLRPQLSQLDPPLLDVERAWLRDSFTKVCVRVGSEEELLAIHQGALDAGLVSHLVTDAGRTEFHGVPTITCCAIGPDRSYDIDKITGDLDLL